MQTVFKSFDFTLTGTLPGEEVLTGIVRDREGRSRPVAIALTSDLSETSRKRKIASIREIIGTPSTSSPEPEKNRKGWLQFGFGEKAQAIPPSPPITAKMKNASFIPQTVEMVLAEGSNGQIIFDCQSKQAFWGLCRYFDLNDSTMFALAEMEKLKPQQQEISQTKPAGDAHILATWLSKQKNSAARHFEQRIRESVKFKLPDFSQSLNSLAANFQADFDNLKQHKNHMNTPLGKFGKFFGRIASLAEKNISEEDMEWLRDRTKIVTKDGLFDYHSHYKWTELESDNAFRQRWEERTGKPLETLHFPQPITELAIDRNRNYYEKFRLKPGHYNLPYQRCLFELDVTRDEDANGPAERFHFYVLAQQEGNEITFTPIMKKEGDPTYMFGRDYTLDMTPGKNMSWRVYDNAVGNVEVQEHGLDYNIYSCAIISALNVVARFNEPDFEQKIVTPTGGQVGKSMGRSPYFQYHLIEDYPEFYRSRGVTSRSDADGERGSVIRHLVRGHLRRITQPDGGMEITYVTSHARGDEEKGFKMPAWKLDQK